MTGTITERIDNVTKIPPRYLAATLPAPKSVKIEISPRCNYRCGFCALRTREAQPKWDMDFALFKRITREMREAGVEEVGVFYLGESFMNPRLLVDCIAYLKSGLAMPYVFLTSNASMAFPEAVEACMKAGLDSLKWSVNAADQQQFEKIMGVAGRLFHTALENIESTWEVRRRGGYQTGLYASSIRYDGAQQEKMEALLTARVRPFVDQHYWLPLYSMGAFATQREAELGYRPTAGNQGRIGALRDPLPCWSAFTEGHVTSEGKLSACCFDATSHWTMGDLNSVPFMDAWNSSSFVAVQLRNVSFGMWVVSMFFIAANASDFIRRNADIPRLVLAEIAGISLLVCVASFALGRLLGGREFAREASQSLGQKNTTFTIYLALAYASPVVALGPTFYVVWHNLWNSWQLHRATRGDDIR